MKKILGLVLIISLVGVIIFATKNPDNKTTESGVSVTSEIAATDAESCAGTPDEYRLDITDRPVDTRTLLGHGVINATGVIARDGCTSIDGPLAAINWWTTIDKERLEIEYDAIVGPLAFKYSRLVFSDEDAESIRVAESPIPDHDTLAVVLYHSAESFTELTGSEIHLKAVPIKEASVADAYSFGLHRCVIGCENPDLPVFPAQVQGSVLVIQYSMPDFKASEIDQSYNEIRDALAVDGRATLAYAGRLAGQSFHELEDGTRTRPFLSEGVDGTLLFELENLNDAEGILSISEVAEFLDETTADVVVTFKGTET